MTNCVLRYYFHWRYGKKILLLIKQKNIQELEKLFDNFVKKSNSTGCSHILGYVCGVNDLFLLTWGIHKYTSYMGILNKKSVTEYGKSLFISYLIKIYRLSSERYLLDILNWHLTRLSINYIIKNYNYEVDRSIVNHNLYRLYEIYFHINDIPNIINEKTRIDYKLYHRIRSIMLVRSVVKNDKLLSANLEMTHIIYKFLFG